MRAEPEGSAALLLPDNSQHSRIAAAHAAQMKVADVYFSQQSQTHKLQSCQDQDHREEQ